jgi:hypothetical protein
MQQQHGDAAGKQSMEKARGATLSEKGLRALTISLANSVNKLNWKMPKTE